VHVTSVIDSLRWDKLRSERVWEEMHNPRPRCTLITYLRYSSQSHWNWLAVTSRLDVRVALRCFEGALVEAVTSMDREGRAVTPTKKHQRTDPTKSAR
jgi:hypothetical protein